MRSICQEIIHGILDKGVDRSNDLLKQLATVKYIGIS